MLSFSSLQLSIGYVHPPIIEEDEEEGNETEIAT